jgi:hypothetical protein
VRGVGPDGGVVDVRLLVRNPNPYALRAERATYRLLTRDSVEVGRGEALDSLEVPARDSAEVRLPVTVTWSALARAGAEALAAGAATGAGGVPRARRGARAHARGELPRPDRRARAGAARGPGGIPGLGAFFGR